MAPELYWDPDGSREEPFRTWLTQHSDDGYVLNCYRTGKEQDDYVAYILHRASCTVFNGNNPRSGKNFTNKQFCKVCSTDAEALQDKAKTKGWQGRNCALCM